MRTLHVLALFSATVLSSACYVDFHDDPGTTRSRRGDLTLRYTFDGRSCVDAGVHRISVRVDGDFNGDAYADTVGCSTFQHGITIEGLREDTYQVFIEGRDANGSLVFGSAEPFQVRVQWGTHQEFDLAVPGMGGGLSIYWTFDGRGACGAVQDLRVTLRDPSGAIYDDQLYPCDYEGVAYDALAHGVWSLSLDGLDWDGRVLYRASTRNLVVIQGAQNDYTVDLSNYR